MTDPILLIPILASFLVTLAFLPSWIKRAVKAGISGRDLHKKDKEKIAEAGGMTFVAGFIFGALIYVSLKTFYFQDPSNLIEIFAILCSIILIALVGFTDDILGWKIGLRRRTRMLFVLVAAIPLMAINAGKSTIAIPFNGVTDIGLLYPILFIPIGILGATTTYNFIAGYNGLEAGQSIIMLLGLGFVAFFTGNPWLSIIALCAISALVAFLLYNYCPAKVFPGDSLTYTVGGLIAIMAIVGNFERIALFFFIPYIIETVLKSRGKLVKQSYGKLQEDGTLNVPYKKFYGLEHIAIYLLQKSGIKSTEKNVVHLLWIFQAIIIILGFIIFREGIFLN